MKTFVLTATAIAIGLAAIFLAKSAHAEMVVIAVSDETPGNELRYVVGSAHVAGDVSRGLFSMTNHGKVDNLEVSLDRESCAEGSGTMFFYEIGHRKPVGTNTWIDGDGSMGDAVASTLCEEFKKPKKTGYKKTTF